MSKPTPSLLPHMCPLCRTKVAMYRERYCWPCMRLLDDVNDAITEAQEMDD